MSNEEKEAQVEMYAEVSKTHERPVAIRSYIWVKAVSLHWGWWGLLDFPAADMRLHPKKAKEEAVNLGHF